jgi:hypothetical protein
VLSDPAQRLKYDHRYPQLYASWCTYWVNLQLWEQRAWEQEQQRAWDEQCAWEAEQQRTWEEEQPAWEEEVAREEEQWEKEEKERAWRRKNKNEYKNRRQRRHYQRRAERQEAEELAQEHEQRNRDRAKAADLEKRQQQHQEALRQKFAAKEERERQRIRRDQERMAAAATERLRKAAEEETAEQERLRKAAEQERRRKAAEEKAAEISRQSKEKQEAYARSKETACKAVQAAQARTNKATEFSQAPLTTNVARPPLTTDAPLSSASQLPSPQLPTWLPSLLAYAHARSKHTAALTALGGPGHEAEIIGTYIELGWTQETAVGKCDFCQREIQIHMYVCPEGGARACVPCRMKYSYWSSC